MAAFSPTDWPTVYIAGGTTASGVLELSTGGRPTDPPVPRPRHVALLGSTGSIGRSTLEVIAASQGELVPLAMSGHHNLHLLGEQIRQFRPRWVAVTDPKPAALGQLGTIPAGTQVLYGPDAIVRLVTMPEIDVVVSAIVGSAGLRGTWAALEAGKPVALANKESLVVGGPLVVRLARQHQTSLLPVDSEHSAIFQSLQAGRRSELKRVILTASGGPFLHYSPQQLAAVTVREALAHPNWSMGRKISIDSATMMNKALEVIEARWLFDLAPDEIAVVIHPQSIVHSLVEFVDGSVIGQLSPPDMRLPIQYALYWPNRRPGPTAKFDWSTPHRLEFHPPDLDRFDALRLGFEVARCGGTSGAVLNAANEAAVAAFLDGQIAFSQIVPLCRAVLEHHTYDPAPSLDQLFRLDQWARRQASRWIRGQALS